MYSYLVIFVQLNCSTFLFTETVWLEKHIRLKYVILEQTTNCMAVIITKLTVTHHYLSDGWLGNQCSSPSTQRRVTYGHSQWHCGRFWHYAVVLHTTVARIRRSWRTWRTCIVMTDSSCIYRSRWQWAKTFTTCCANVGDAKTRNDLVSGRFTCFCNERTWATHQRSNKQDWNKKWEQLMLL